MICSVIDCGAVGDGKTLVTAAVQEAIDRCAAAGGGTAVVPAGTFYIGTIYLRSNVELHLEKGATLLGSENLEDYNAPDAYPQNWHSEKEQWNACHLILGVGIENAAITGEGTIDGNGTLFYADTHHAVYELAWRKGCRLARDKKNLRPGQMVVFVESSDIAVRDVKMQNASCWTLLFHGCSEIRVHGIRIKNEKYHANTDGIDVDCCRNVVISDCVINTGDDAITLRADCARLLDKTKCCENIAISNCVLSTACNAMRVGVGAGIIRNVTVSNISVEECCSVLHIQSVYGAAKPIGVSCYDLRFSNFSCSECCTPICIEAGSPIVESIMQNISFEHFTIRCSHTLRVNGAEKCVPENIHFSNIELFISDPLIPLKTTPQPEAFIVVNKAKDVFFDHVRIHWQTKTADYWKKNIAVTDTEGLEITASNI